MLSRCESAKTMPEGSIICIYLMAYQLPGLGLFASLYGTNGGAHCSGHEGCHHTDSRCGLPHHWPVEELRRRRYCRIGRLGAHIRKKVLANRYRSSCPKGGSGKVLLRRDDHGLEIDHRARPIEADHGLELHRGRILFTGPEPPPSLLLPRPVIL